jgi:DNA recombination-dependent growth factor C
MAISSASATFCRFHVPDPVTEDFWGYVMDCLRAGCFRELEDDQEQSVGFSSWDDFFDASFAYASHHKGDYVAFTLRLDQRRVPAVILRYRVRQALQEYRREHDGRWPSRQEKEQLRENLHRSLLKRSLPRPSACEAIWNPDQHWLLVGTTGRKILEAFLEHFEKHFRVFPAPLYHVNWALHLVPLDGRQKDLLTGLVLPKSTQVLQDGRFLGYEFLTWLWFFIEQSQGVLTLPNAQTYTISLGEKLVLSHPDDGRERVVCTTQALALHEARTALQQGKRVQEAQLILSAGDNDYQLTLDATLWSIKGLKTPRQLPDFDSEDQDGRFLEKMFFLEEVFAGLNGLYQRFLARRLSSGWESDTLPAVKQWIEGKDLLSTPF